MRTHVAPKLIDGVEYLSLSQIYELFHRIVPHEIIREAGKGWQPIKFNGRWYFRSDLVALPGYPLAKWQRMTLAYIHMLKWATWETISPILQQDKYYVALAFLKAAGIQKLFNGQASVLPDGQRPQFCVLDVRGNCHVVVTNEREVIGGRVEWDRISSELADGTCIWEPLPVANEMAVQLMRKAQS